MAQFYKAAKAVDVASGKLRYVEIEGRHIALFSVGQEIYALGDLQSHSMIPASQREAVADRLSDVLSDSDVSHRADDSAARGRLNDGAAGSSTVESIERYNVRVQDGDVEIEIN